MFESDIWSSSNQKENIIVDACSITSTCLQIKRKYLKYSKLFQQSSFFKLPLLYHLIPFFY